jgi:hypothetical protein
LGWASVGCLERHSSTIERENNAKSKKRVYGEEKTKKGIEGRKRLSGRAR